MNTKKDSLFLRFLYHTVIGRCILRIMSGKYISKLCAIFLNSGFSKVLIKSFIKRNNIDIKEYYCEDIKSFNDFFSRKIREKYRLIDMQKDSLISPCDGLLKAYKIENDLVLPIKHSQYTITSLLKDEKLAKKYHNGVILVIRLCVDNYHRYCYVDCGKKEDNIFIPGKLHTVRPIALEKFPVFIQNSREYTIIHTDNFGDVIQMEVGALLVGKIKNYHQEQLINKGQEKGTFLFGGSTIIVLLEKDKVDINEIYFQNEETFVKMGQKIGSSKKKRLECKSKWQNR